jgi:hypothetical protein
MTYHVGTTVHRGSGTWFTIREGDRQKRTTFVIRSNGTIVSAEVALART